MFFLLQIDPLEVAEKVHPANYFVWGAFATVGYVIATLLWRQLWLNQKKNASLIEALQKSVEGSNKNVEKLTSLLREEQERNEKKEAANALVLAQINQSLSKLATVMETIISFRLNK